MYLGRCLSKIAQRPISPLSRTDLRESCSRLPYKTIIVLDDLPESDSTAQMEEALALLANACTELGICLFTTATGRLSHYLRERVSNLSELGVPLFDNENTLSLLNLFHAPDEYLKPWFVEYVNLLTQKNPLLLRAAAQYCAEKGWPLPPLDTLSDLLGNRFGKDIDADTITLLRATLPDDTTRGFLYRLQLIGNRFTVDDALTVASVPPAVAHPQEKLQILNGIWIEKDSQAEYVISPRIARLPKGNLTPTMERSVHLAVAFKVLQKRTLNQRDVIAVVAHYISAGDPHSALNILLLALRAFAATTGVNPEDWLLSSIWYDTELPPEFDRDDRAELRVAQVLARKRAGEDARFAILDLMDLLQGPEAISPGAFIPAALTVSVELMFERPSETTLLLRDAIRLIGQEETVRPELPTSLRLTAAQMLWGPGVSSQTNDEAFAWLQTALDLDTVALRSMCGSEIAYEAAQRVCDAIWIRQSDLEESDRRWPTLLEALAALTTRAITAKAGPLVAGLLRARIIILMDYLRDRDSAVDMTEEIMPALQPDPAAEFLISSTLGQQYYFQELVDKAEPWLERAAELESFGSTTQRVYALLYASIVKAAHSPAQSLEYVERATAIATSRDDISQSLKVRSLGEQAVALWLRSGVEAAYESIRQAAELLLNLNLSDEKERSLFFLFGNTLGYFIYLASGQVPPEEFIVPTPGIFLDFSSRFAVLFKSEQVWFLGMQLAFLAEEVGRISDAGHFAEMVISTAGVSPTALWPMFTIVVAQKAVQSDYMGILETWRAVTILPLTNDGEAEGADSFGEIPIIAIGFSIAHSCVLNEIDGREKAGGRARSGIFGRAGFYRWG